MFIPNPISLSEAAATLPWGRDTFSFTTHTQKLLHFFPSRIWLSKMSPPQDSESLQELFINTISC